MTFDRKFDQAAERLRGVHRVDAPESIVSGASGEKKSADNLPGDLPGNTGTRPSCLLDNLLVAGVNSTCQHDHRGGTLMAIPFRSRREVWMRVKDPAKIRRWRKQRHFTQRDLAYLVRRSQTAIYALECGKLRTISEDFAIAVAARLDVPWEELFEAEEIKPMPAVATGVRTGARVLAAA
jgi:DNA-binding XRE family transcriptional regulator